MYDNHKLSETWKWLIFKSENVNKESSHYIQNYGVIMGMNTLLKLVQCFAVYRAFIFIISSDFHKKKAWSIFIMPI